jgi:hypothetical protein
VNADQFSCRAEDLLYVHESGVRTDVTVVLESPEFDVFALVDEGKLHLRIVEQFGFNLLQSSLIPSSDGSIEVIAPDDGGAIALVGKLPDLRD